MLTWNGRAVTFVRATPQTAPDVLAVLDHAATWLRDSGVRQWPARFQPQWVERSIGNGETWLATVDGRVAGTATLDRDDPLWTDMPGQAGYLHRMAVERWAKGVGGVILAWAEECTAQHGGQALRLDCVATNARLRAYYEAAGFWHRGDVEVHGAPGQRLNGGTLTVVSRYERPFG